MTRKKFIKLAMSMGYSRNWLDRFCRLSIEQLAEIRKDHPDAVFTWFFQFITLASAYYFFGNPYMPKLDGRKLLFNQTAIQADGKI